MLKAAVLTVLVACAFGMNMPDLGGLMSQAQGMLGNMNGDDIESMLKGIDPNMMKGMINNLPPQFSEMLSGMGFSKDDLAKAVDEIPSHMDQVKGLFKKEGGLDIKSALGGMVDSEMAGDIDNLFSNFNDPEKREEVLSKFRKQVSGALEEFGLNIEDLNDLPGLMPELFEKMKSYLKDSGVEMDFDNPKSLMENIQNFFYGHFGFSKNEDPEKVKEVLGNFLKENLTPLGIEFDPTNPIGSFSKAKGLLMSKAKDFGLDIKDGANPAEIKETLMGKMKDLGIDLSDPSSLMKFATEHMGDITSLMGSFMGGMGGMGGMPSMERPMPMGMPMRMPMRPRGPQMQPMTIDIELSLPQPPSVMPRYMAETEGSTLSDDAVEELLRDLLHYRAKARVLAAKNMMLERQLAASQGYRMIRQ